ncbi:MAG: type I methionyl aminopeptidase [Erysipelotrichia bacterium]|nr:type I methionyl aminopeptidase [Erysipelotrichia bacterium]
MIIIKSPREIAIMKEAGRLVAKVFEMVGPMIKPGVSTYEINEAAEKIIYDAGGSCPCKGYYGYPAGTCVSVNDTLIHGIPSKKIIVQEGDIVSLDVVACLKGYCADATRTFLVGAGKENVKRLMEVCRQAFFAGIKQAKPGQRVGDISAAIQQHVESAGYQVARNFAGHGIGKNMHEEPSVPNYGTPGTGPLLQVGMALAVEPMILEGQAQTRVLEDGWTVKSKDGKLTCHYENTIIIAEGGCEIITLTEGEKKING